MLAGRTLFPWRVSHRSAFIFVSDRNTGMSKKVREEVQRKGHEIAQGDENHPGGAKKRQSASARIYGQGAGHGGYSAERNLAKGQTGPADLVKKRGGGKL